MSEDVAGDDPVLLVEDEGEPSDPDTVLFDDSVEGVDDENVPVVSTYGSEGDRWGTGE